MKLTPEQYFKWKSAMDQITIAQTRLNLAQTQLSMMEKDIELAQFKAIMYKNGTVAAQDVSYSNAKSDYLAVKTQLESELGVSLANVSINPETYEVISESN